MEPRRSAASKQGVAWRLGQRQRPRRRPAFPAGIRAVIVARLLLCTLGAALVATVAAQDSITFAVQQPFERIVYDGDLHERRLPEWRPLPGAYVFLHERAAADATGGTAPCRVTSLPPTDGAGMTTVSLGPDSPWGADIGYYCPGYRLHPDHGSKIPGVSRLEQGKLTYNVCMVYDPDGPRRFRSGIKRASAAIYVLTEDGLKLPGALVLGHFRDGQCALVPFGLTDYRGCIAEATVPSKWDKDRYLEELVLCRPGHKPCRQPYRRTLAPDLDSYAFAPDEYLVLTETVPRVRLVCEVRDADTNEPLDNVTVDVWRLNRTVCSGETGRDGTVRFDDCPQTNVTLTASREGYEPFTGEPVQPDGKTRRTLRLSPVKRQVRVLAADERGGLPKVLVSLYRLSAEANRDEVYDQRETDAAGTCLFPRCVTEPLEVRVEHPDYGPVPGPGYPVRIPPGRAAADIPIRMHPIPRPVTLYGEVHNRNAAPVANGTVRVVCQSAAEPHVARTNGQGKFEVDFEHERGQEIQVEVTHPSYLPRRERLFDVPEQPLSLVMAAPTRTLLVVLDSSSRMSRSSFHQVKRALVTLLQEAARSPGWGALAAGTATGGGLQMALPFTAGGVTPALLDAAAEAIMAANAAGATNTLQTLQALPDLMVKNDACGRPDARSRICLVMVPDLFFDGMTMDNAALKKLGQQFSEQGMELCVAEVLGEDDVATPVLGDLCASTGGKASTIRGGRGDSTDLGPAILGLKWHEASAPGTARKGGPAPP